MWIHEISGKKGGANAKKKKIVGPEIDTGPPEWAKKRKTGDERGDSIPVGKGGSVTRGHLL